MKLIERLTPIAMVILQIGPNWGGHAASILTGTQVPKDVADIMVVGIALIWLLYQLYKYAEKRNNERNAALLEKLSRPHGSISMQAVDPKLPQLYSQYLPLKEDQSKPDKEPGS
jgi:hypothetical protein